MGFKRMIFPKDFLTNDKLTEAMADIGIRVGKRPALKSPNIEDVLLSASLEALENQDWRTLSLVVQWFCAHSVIINVDRLTRMLIELEDHKKLIIFWSALAQTTKHDLRFKRLQELYKGKRSLLGDNNSSKMLLKRNGEDERFKNTSLVVPNKMLRKRESDILELKELVKVHQGAYYRVMLGPSYRADCFCELMKDKLITASEAARLSYSSFKTAWDAKNDWEIIKIAS